MRKARGHEEICRRLGVEEGDLQKERDRRVLAFIRGEMSADEVRAAYEPPPLSRRPGQGTEGRGEGPAATG